MEGLLTGAIIVIEYVADTGSDQAIEAMAVAHA